MHYEIDIEDMVQAPAEAIPALEMAVTITLDTLGATPTAGLTIVLGDDYYLRTLNSQFRHEDHPTDVLSFPAGDAMPGLVGEITYLGDIAISVPYAQRQADYQGHQLIAELQLLAIHGVLHLNGYDHSTTEEKDDMWRQQQLILEKLGLGHIQPTEGDSGH